MTNWVNKFLIYHKELIKIINSSNKELIYMRQPIKMTKVRTTLAIWLRQQKSYVLEVTRIGNSEGLSGNNQDLIIIDEELLEQ